MALCVQVCWCLNKFEGIWRQDWLLSSSERALQGISLKRWIHWGLEWNRKPCPRPASSDAPGKCVQALWRTACLAPASVFLLLLTCPAVAAAVAAVRKYHPLTVRVVLSKYKKLLVQYVRMSHLSNSYSRQTRSSIISRVTANCLSL